jgi:hypothetical protein
MAKRMRRVAPGDVFELGLRDGYSYLQLIGKNKTFGWAARVVAPVRPDPMSDPDAAADGADLYVVLIGDVAFEEHEGRLRYVGRAPLPERHRDKLPVFRANSSYMPDGRHHPDQWWLDDGEKEWRVGRLSEEQQHLPYHRFTPISGLRMLIECGWDPEWEFKPGGREFAHEPPPLAETQPDTATFFMTFRNRSDAVRAGDEVRRDAKFSSASVDEYTDDDALAYVVSAKADRGVSLESAESTLERIAASHGGDYDGNEVPLKISGP